MIELSNVSTERLITFLEYARINDSEKEEAYSTLMQHLIRDYQILKSELRKGGGTYDNAFLKDALEAVEQNIAYANSVGRQPVMFKCNNYKNTDVYRKTLKITDKQNLCGVLLCKSPLIINNQKYNMFDKLTIEEVKDLLIKVVGHDKISVGNNAFLEKMKNFTVDDVENIINAINFYEMQVLRQAREIKKRGINLFTENKLVKEQIVRSQLNDIIKYLIDNADVFVWGELSHAEKTKLIYAISSNGGYENQIIKDRMIKAIADYTTLSELEKGVVKNKTLDRFIIK